MTDNNDYLQRVVDQVLVHWGAGEIDSMSKFVREKLLESYRNGIARGKSEAERKGRTA